MSARILAVANQKGGSGKTTTALALAVGAVRYLNLRVLLVDCDPQANATTVLLGVKQATGPAEGNIPTIYEVLCGDKRAHQVVRRLRLPGEPGEPSEPSEDEAAGTEGLHIDVLPSHLRLSKAEFELVAVYARERKLKTALMPLANYYDLIIIDCPPSLGLLTQNSFVAANELVVPVEPGVFPLVGLGYLRETMAVVRANDNPNLRVAAVIPTMSERTNLSADTISKLENGFGDLVTIPIPRRVAIGEAHARMLDIFAADPKSDVAQAYKAIVIKLFGGGND